MIDAWLNIEFSFNLLYESLQCVHQVFFDASLPLLTRPQRMSFHPRRTELQTVLRGLGCDSSKLGDSGEVCTRSNPRAWQQWRLPATSAMVLMFASPWEVVERGWNMLRYSQSCWRDPTIEAEHIMPRVSDWVSPCLLDTANIDLLKILQYRVANYRRQSISDLMCFNVVRNAISV